MVTLPLELAYTNVNVTVRCQNEDVKFNVSCVCDPVTVRRIMENMTTANITLSSSSSKLVTIRFEQLFVFKMEIQLNGIWMTYLFF